MTKLSTIGFLALALAACNPNKPGAEVREATASAEKGAPAVAVGPSAQATTSAAAPAAPMKLELGDLGSCQPSDDVRKVVTRVVDLADADGNGEISRLEAQSAVSFVLGGLFVRADQNGDGKVTPEEGRQVREELLQSHPAVAALLTQAREATGESPFRAIGDLANLKYDQALTLEQVRKAARSALDDLFRLVDTDKNAVITQAEASQASLRGARELGSRAFAATDTNHDKYLEQSEFQRAIDDAAKSVFSLADADRDGRLTQNEAAAAAANVGRRLGIPAL
jgi:Ca2+-binding EF-hand superfamily protein